MTVPSNALIPLTIGQHTDLACPLGRIRTTYSGEIMTLFVLAAVGFVGMALALLDDGSDIDFRSRQLAGAYRRRWA